MFGKLLWMTGLLTSLPVIDLHKIKERRGGVAVCKRGLFEEGDRIFTDIYIEMLCNTEENIQLAIWSCACGPDGARQWHK